MMVLMTGSAAAQQSVVDAINEYGKFDRWSRREIKESGIIGGNTKYLYEFYGDYGTKSTGKTPHLRAICGGQTMSLQSWQEYARPIILSSLKSVAVAIVRESRPI